MYFDSYRLIDEELEVFWVVGKKIEKVQNLMIVTFVTTVQEYVK